MKKILALCCLAGLLSACASTSDPSNAYKDETPQQIYQRGKVALQDKSYNEAIKRFEALDVQYPFGKETEYAQLYLIYAHYMKEDYAEAVTAANRFIRLHPVSPHVDYAHYMRGISNYYQNMGVLEKIFAIDLATRDLTQMQKSYADFAEIALHYPHSKYAPAAHQYMIYLRNMMATHELHIAEYYYNHRAYMAAANRVSDLVAHYQGAPSVKPGLALLVKSYRALGLTKLAADAERVYVYNYGVVPS